MKINNQIKLLIFAIALTPLSLFSQEHSTTSWGALDFVSEPVHDATIGVLDSFIGKSDTPARSTANLGSSLDFVCKAYSKKDYYSSGATNLGQLSVYQSGGIWTGQKMMDSLWGDRITSMFGYRPYFGRMHKGVDIAMCIGDTVRVPLDGVVDRINFEPGGYGEYIVIQHDNGLETRYAHLSTVFVVPGDKVSAMQPIALSGNSGNSTGPHLHLETRINGEAIDPMSLFDFTDGNMRPIAHITGASDEYSKDGIGSLNQVLNLGTKDKALLDKRTYVVRVGDTVSKIAGRAGISKFDFCRMNSISEDAKLTPGTMLRLRR